MTPAWRGGPPAQPTANGAWPSPQAGVRFAAQARGARSPADGIQPRVLDDTFVGFPAGAAGVQQAVAEGEAAAEEDRAADGEGGPPVQQHEVAGEGAPPPANPPPADTGQHQAALGPTSAAAMNGSPEQVPEALRDVLRLVLSS